MTMIKQARRTAASLLEIALLEAVCRMATLFTLFALAFVGVFMAATLAAHISYRCASEGIIVLSQSVSRSAPRPLQVVTVAEA